MLRRPAATDLTARMGPFEKLALFTIGLNLASGQEAAADGSLSPHEGNTAQRSDIIVTSLPEIGEDSAAWRRSGISLDPASAAPIRLASFSSDAEPAPLQAMPAILEARLPVVLDGRRLQPVPVRTTISTLLGVSPIALSDSLGDFLEEPVREALIALGPDLARPEQLEPLGVVARLNPQTLSVEIDLAPRARRPAAISAGGDPALADFDLLQPSRYSAGLTFSALALDGINDERDAAGQVSFSGFANLGGIEGINLLYGGTSFLEGGNSTFRRDAVTLFRDDGGRVLRYSGGDLTPTMPRFAGSTGILGLSVERSYIDLQPTRNVRPSGRRSFVLDRLSTVEIYANDQLVTRFLAEAGAIDLTDIPLLATSNNIRIVVEDDFRREEIDAFTLVNDLTLLSRGLDEFSFSIGLNRDQTAIGYEYGEDLVAQGYYSRGLTDTLTLGGHISASKDLSNAGVSLATAAPRGVALLEAAVSSSEGSGSGFTAGVSYRAGPFFGVDRNDLFTVRAEYSSERYASFNDFQSSRDIKLDIGADFRMDLSPRTSFSVSGGYAERYSIPGSDLFASIGIGRRIGRASLSAAATYSKSAITSREDAGFLVSLSMPLGRRAASSASYSSVSETLRADIVRSRRAEVPDYNYRLSAISRVGGSEYSGGLGYATSRFETDVSLLSTSPSSGFANTQTATFRIQSGIAVADGSAGVSRDPSRGFYMFRKHSSLKDSTLEVSAGGAGMRVAETSWFGPAVAPVRTPYRPETLQTSVTNAPLGYNLGPGRYNFMPGARTGTVVTVGQDAYRTVVGSVLFDGIPIALGYGRLRNLQTGEETTFFTNRTGRTAFSELAPGSYEGSFDALGLRFRFEVKASDPAYTNIGNIYAERIQ